MTWDWEFALEITPQLLRAFLVTLQAVAFGYALAMVLGLLLCSLRRSSLRLVSLPAAATVEFIRSTPLLIQVYFLYFLAPKLGLELGALATGVIALGLHYGSYLSEVYRSGIDGVPSGQWEASRALGLGGVQTYRHVVLPQALPPILPVLGNYLIAMFKDTPLLSVITVVEVLNRAQLIGKESFRYLEPLTLVGLLYLVASLVASRLVAMLEARTGVARTS